MKKNNKKNNKHILFFDDFCPLCISTIKFMKVFVKPKHVKYQPISLSNLSQEEKDKALVDMLLRSEEGEIYWGIILISKFFIYLHPKLVFFLNFSPY